MLWLQAFLIFVFSVVNDWLSVQWHVARERGWPFRGALVAVLLGTLGWLSIWWVVTQSVYLILADIAGTAVGSYWSFVEYSAGKEGKVTGLTPIGIANRVWNALRKLGQQR